MTGFFSSLDAMEAHLGHVRPDADCEWCQRRIAMPPEPDGYGGLSEFDLDHFEAILGGAERFSWFTAQLMHLIAKADPFNIERLRAGFPAEVAAYERWRATGDPH